MDILFITSNSAKVALANERLKKYNINVKQYKFGFKELQDLDVEKVALDKANQLKETIETPFLIEDSGFYVEALNGLPGTFIKPIFESISDERFLKLLDVKDSRKVTAKSVLVYSNPKNNETKLFLGYYEGVLSDKPRGSNKRGWAVTRIFIPNGWNKTLAELNDKEWNQFLEEFRKNDHFEQFGKWAKLNLS